MLNSRNKARPRSAIRTSPTAMARMMVATVWEPALPPVPLTTGIKRVRMTNVRSSSPYALTTVSVSTEAAKSGTSQTTRLATTCQMETAKYGLASGSEPPRR